MESKKKDLSHWYILNHYNFPFQENAFCAVICKFIVTEWKEHLKSNSIDPDWDQLSFFLFLLPKEESNCEKVEDLGYAEETKANAKTSPSSKLC